jgi:hypothetical protein
MMMKRLSSVALMIALGALIGLVACEAGAPGKTGTNSSGSSNTAAAKPAGAAAQSGAVAAAPTDGKGEPANVTEVFPQGPGRDVVLNNCGSCHNLACSAIGQRTSARWESLKESHKDKVTDADAAAAFSYLQSHFNDANPEPKVPPKFLQGGCTPF